MNTDKIYAEAIANEYSKKSATKVTQLKKLDQAAKRPANIFAFTFGIVALLIAGAGMSICLGALGDGGMAVMVLGVVLGVLGFAGCGVNFFLYRKLLTRGKEKYAGDIIRLAGEIVAQAE